MPDSFMTPFPFALTHLEAMKIPIRTGEKILDTGIEALSLGRDMSNGFNDLSRRLKLLSGLPKATSAWY